MQTVSYNSPIISVEERKINTYFIFARLWLVYPSLDNLNYIPWWIAGIGFV